MFMNGFDSNLVWWQILFDNSLTELEVIQRHRSESKNSLPIISPTFQSIWIEFGILLRLVDVMNLIIMLSCPFSIQGRELYYISIWFRLKNFNVCLYSDI